jgi:hypothetical protein
MKEALPLAALLLASCAAPMGFDRGALARQVRPDAAPVTEEEIARVLAVRPQLPGPFQLAVYFRPPSGERFRGFGHGTWLWSGEEKEAVLGRVQPLVGTALSKVITVASGTVAGEDLKSIRLAAARHGADAVLVVSGAGQVDRYNTAGSALYWTINQSPRGPCFP